MSLKTTTAHHQTDEDIAAEVDHAHEQEAFGVRINLWFLRPTDGQPVQLTDARVLRYGGDRSNVILRTKVGSNQARWEVPLVNIIWAQAVDRLGRQAL